VISDGYYGLGLVSFIRHNLSNSQAHLERALRFRNDFIGHGPIKGSLGDVFYSQGEYKTAALFYRESLKEKKIEPVLVKLAWCLYFMNDKGGAQDLFRKGMETAKDRRPFLTGSFSLPMNWEKPQKQRAS
jgi:tetratricopeptide (TPR) repeat protein